MKPLCVDLYCGLGGWAQGFLAEGYGVIGFDIERHDYGTGGYPGQLVLQDALTLHGSQFRDAACIVCSPPCQEYSYMAMPWSRAKAKAAAIRADETGEARRNLTALFDCCFRLQREASEAAGRHIPMVVENVRGAQPWVGRAPWNYGSFYLWGDVPALMPFTWKAQKFNPDGTQHGQGSWFAVADSKNRGARNVPAWQREFGLPGEPDPHGPLAREAGRKVPGMNFHDHEKTGKPGRSFQSAAVDSLHDPEVGIKQHGSGPVWFDRGIASHGSASHARKAASAQIAKIPFELAAHIARCFKPVQKEQVA